MIYNSTFPFFFQRYAGNTLQHGIHFIHNDAHLHHCDCNESRCLRIERHDKFGYAGCILRIDHFAGVDVHLFVSVGVCDSGFACNWGCFLRVGMVLPAGGAATAIGGAHPAGTAWDSIAMLGSVRLFAAHVFIGKSSGIGSPTKPLKQAIASDWRKIIRVDIVQGFVSIQKCQILLQIIRRAGSYFLILRRFQ